MMAGRRLRAALVTPLSGPLARYGRAGATALGLWAMRAGLELEIGDAYPSAAAAVAAVTAPRPVDVLFGPYGTGPALAAARAAPCFGTTVEQPAVSPAPSSLTWSTCPRRPRPTWQR